jgi:hypothetical protein
VRNATIKDAFMRNLLQNPAARAQPGLCGPDEPRSPDYASTDG